MSAQPVYSPEPIAIGNNLLITEIHTDTEAHLTRVVEATPDGLVLRRSPARTPSGRHVWLEFALPPAGRIRVLAELVGRGPETTRYVFKHFWPADRARYMAFIGQAIAA